MENFPANLDDGELWIPSDIFPKDELHHNDCHNNRSIRDDGSLLEDLSRQLCNLKSNDLFLTPNVSHLSKEFGGYSGAMTQNSSAITLAPAPSQTPAPAPTPTQNGCSDLKDGPKRVDDRGRPINNQPGPVHRLPALPFPMPQPANPTVGQPLKETKTGNKNRKGYRHQPKHNWVFPTQTRCRGVGFGFGLMNSNTTSSGTGVFIPRPNSDSFETTEVKPQWMPTTKVGTKKDDDEFRHNTPPEVGLPKDWTY